MSSRISYGRVKRMAWVLLCVAASSGDGVLVGGSRGAELELELFADILMSLYEEEDAGSQSG